MKADDKYTFLVNGTFYCATLRHKVSIKNITIEAADAYFKAGCKWLELTPKREKEGKEKG